MSLDAQTQPEAPPTPEAPEVSAPDPFEVSKGIQPSAWTIVIYGIPGVGKSTIGTYAPSPFFIDLENGLTKIACEKTKKRPASMDEVINWLRWFVRNPAYKTVVIDTIDELEKFMAAKVVAANRPYKTVADIPYGRGGDYMVNEWRAFIDILEHVRNAGKNVLLTGHEQVIKFENPSDANFDFYSMNIHKKAAPVVTAKMDAVLFARFETLIKDKDEKKGKGKAQMAGGRILLTSQGASWVAKNRFSLPEVVPMQPDIFTKLGGI